jgi:septum formation protein
MDGMKVVLASGSPRRRELLAAAGVSFEVRPAAAEECHDATLPVTELCERNAELKARSVKVAGAWVIGADTLVHIDGEPLGKPRDLGEARAMLRRLSGREHLVCTGVCVVAPGGSDEAFHEITKVRFRELDEGEIENYLGRVDPLDKAGAYGIQEHGEMLVESIDGAFDNVMGLPVGAVLARLGACSEGVKGVEFQ